MTSVKVIEDSIAGEVRLTTLQLRYPRFVHAEFMTHRVFSRNASSSRAIPVKKMLEQVSIDPAMPIHWGMNQKGMQADNEVANPEQAREFWMIAASRAVEVATAMERAGLHKQVVNRILEPFQFISVIVTATEWENFFALRCHPDAQPEIRQLAEMMREAMNASTPVSRDGENAYHLPYIQPAEREKFHIQDLVKFSVARCARVSYLTHDGEQPNPENDIELYKRLVGGSPMHASPTEHQARPTKRPSMNVFNGNFHPKWIQYRKCLEVTYMEPFYSGDII